MTYCHIAKDYFANLEYNISLNASIEAAMSEEFISQAGKLEKLLHTYILA